MTRSEARRIAEAHRYYVRKGADERWHVHRFGVLVPYEARSSEAEAWLAAGERAARQAEADRRRFEFRGR